MSSYRQHWIMHLDMDAFFAAIEQRDNPEFRARPVVVGARPGGRGVVSTCSYEARRFGIRSAMPINEAYRRCPGAVYLRPDMERYSKVSRQLMDLLEGISPIVEPVSVDEAYLDLTGLERLQGDVARIGERTRALVRQQLGLPCSVGVAPNRLLAKLASEAAKPDGLRVVRPDQVREFLDPMPVSALRGVGRQTLKALDRLGIRSVAQLRGYPLQLLSLHLGAASAQALLRQAQGQGSHRVGVESRRKSISRENTFESDQRDPEIISSTLLELSAGVGRIARREGVRGRRVGLKLRTGGVETHSLQRRLPKATDRDREIYRAARQLYTQSGYRGVALRLIGVGIGDWEDEVPEPDLFDDHLADERERRLYLTLDRIGERFGCDKLVPGRILRSRARGDK